MKTDIVDAADIKIVKLKGKITIGEGDIQLRNVIDELLEDGNRKIILDMGDISYMDSSGVGELVSCYTTITNRGGELRLTRLKSKILSLLQLTALVTVFQIYDTNEDAMQSFG